MDFLEIWTKKEAFLKLNGIGLFINPKEVITSGAIAKYSGILPLHYRFANVLVLVSEYFVLTVSYPLFNAEIEVVGLYNLLKVL